MEGTKNSNNRQFDSNRFDVEGKIVDFLPDVSLINQLNNALRSGDLKGEILFDVAQVFYFCDYEDCRIEREH
jgi:hypothetical protein